jgi:NhaP-type Na+/H+ or K+/H+ antiporter
LVIAQRSADRSTVDAGKANGAGTLLEWEGTALEVVGIGLALLVFEVALAGHLNRDTVPAMISVATIVLGGSTIGVAIGIVLAALLRQRWIPDRSRQLVLLAVAIAAFALANLWYEDSGFFVVLALGLYLANQKYGDLVRRTSGTGVPPALISGVLVVLAARISLDDVIAMDTGARMSLGLLLLVVLLLSVRLATWRTRLPRHTQLALTSPASTTAIVIAVAALCGLRLGELREPHADLIATLTVLVVFVRLSVSSVVGVFETRWFQTAAPRPEAPGQVTPATS